jgi:hypothetical protein
MLYQNPTYYKRTNIGRNKTAYLFDNLDLVNRFIQETEQRCTGKCRSGFNRISTPSYISERAAKVSWYGTTDVNLVKKPIDFLRNNELENYLEILRSRIVNVDQSDIDQQKAIRFTEKEIGVFSFDLASLGLIPVYEFYSPLLKSFVSPNLVVSETNANGELLFFHIYTPEIVEHVVKYNTSTAGYYSNILKRNVDRTELVEISNVEFVYPRKDEVQKHLLEREHKLDENGNKKFTTTFKRCFIEIPKIEKPLPRIDIIVGNTFPSIAKADTEFIYNAVGAIALAEKLSKSGIQYRMIVCTDVKSENGHKSFAFTNIKKEGEVLSRNNISILTSDARFLRWNTFKLLYAIQYDSGQDNYISVSTIGTVDSTSDDIKNAYIDMLSLSDNPIDIESSKRPNTKIVFANSRSLQQAEDEYNRIIETLKNL